jgi:hypothetical protein
MIDPAESLRPVRIALLVFACLLPVVGCLSRQTMPTETASAPPMFEEALTDGKTPVVVRPPAKPLDWQKRPPCDADAGEEAINGACYFAAKRVPPCGRLVEHEGSCYRAIAKAPREPTSIRR